MKWVSVKEIYGEGQHTGAAKVRAVKLLEVLVTEKLSTMAG